MPPLPTRINLRIVAGALALVVSAFAYQQLFGGEPTGTPTRGCLAPTLERHRAAIEDPGPTLEELRRQGPPALYIAKPGDNLDVIGRKVGKTWEQLAALNPQLNPLAEDRCREKSPKYRNRPVEEGFYCNDRLLTAGVGKTDIRGPHSIWVSDPVLVW